MNPGDDEAPVDETGPAEPTAESYLLSAEEGLALIEAAERLLGQGLSTSEATLRLREELERAGREVGAGELEQHVKAADRRLRARTFEGPGGGLMGPTDDARPSPEERLARLKEQLAGLEDTEYVLDPVHGFQVLPHAIASRFAERRPGVLEAARVGGRLQWWVRSSKSGLMTPEYGNGVHAKIRQFVHEEWPQAYLPTRAVRDVAEELAALSPHRDPSLEPEELDLQDLLAMEQTEPEWVVPGLLAPGLTILAGASKIGKSWAVLDLLTGHNWLDTFPVFAERALYLALEDTDRRLAERLQLMGATGRARPLSIFTSWPGLSSGALDRLDGWLGQRPDTRLVVIDTLGRLRGSLGSDGYNYQADVQMLAPLKEVADRHRVALVVVHHTRKGESDSPLDRISGTVGLPATADTAMLLERVDPRQQSPAKLWVQGRDMLDADLDLEFANYRWRNVFGAREQVLRAVEELGAGANGALGVSRREVVEETGLPDGTVKRWLPALVDDGKLTKLGRGAGTRYLKGD